MSASPVVLWFRQDLRLSDNPALCAALERRTPILPLYIWAPEEETPWPPGAASRWWLHRSLQALDRELRRRGSRLVVRHGPSLPTLRTLAKESGATTILWNRRYEPAAIRRDTEIKSALRSDGLTVETYNSALLFEPWELRNNSGKSFQVFTPFWRACLARPKPIDPIPAPDTLPTAEVWPSGATIDSLALEPTIDWASGLRDTWIPGEAGASMQLERFLDEGLAGYREHRNHPDRPGSSRLSPYLHFGEIGPRQIWHAVERRLTLDSAPYDDAETFLREIGWREFAHHLLFHFPHTPEAPLRPEFQAFPWLDDRDGMRAWQRGRTGYPIVDAGMRELWATGWMHNRVRMIAASFLVKDLLLPWPEGARWFWDTLVDADLANNTLGWQWTSGCGADAAPYFRVFNPVLQGMKFDPQGHYVRRWIPELAALPDTLIHSPWKADVPAATYPPPIVDHNLARQRALAALAQVKKSQR